jgi:hypothetical protein
MPTTLTGTGVTYNSGQTTTQTKPFIKYGYASTPGTNIALSTADTFMPGCEINMGVPASANNWYRIEYQTVQDDWPGGNNGGAGASIYRWTPSSGWERVLGQGEHAQYESNAGDFYTNCSGLFYVPVHQTYPNQPHSFRLYGMRHPDVGIRWSCDIGADNRVGGWNNTLFEVAEMDSTVAQTFTGMTRY